VLGGVFVATGVLAALVLSGVLTTVFFAVTAAYLLVPFRDALTGRGLSPWWASLVATVTVFAAVILSLAPLAVVVGLRVDQVVDFLQSAPETVTVDLFGIAYAVSVEETVSLVTSAVTRLARDAAGAVPVFALKLTVFTMVVFALLLHQQAVRRAVLGVVPPAYRDVAEAFDECVRSTLFAVYVLQAATAAGTFLVALPVFWFLGYSIPITLAVVAAVLQFIPIVGPSLLILGLVTYHLVVGQQVTALLVLVVAGVLVAWLPDVLIRPRLAEQTTGLSGTLYFVGFVGGILTLGVVGVVAGPLAIAVLAEAASLLTADLNEVPVVED
jgi:predicted PurR-regulated permease PerM